MTDPTKKIEDHKDLSGTEGMVLRYLSLVDSQRYHQRRAEKLAGEIKKLRKENPELRNIMGEIQKFEKMSDDPEKYEEKRAKKKEKLKAKKSKKRVSSEDNNEEGSQGESEIEPPPLKKKKATGGSGTQRRQLENRIQKKPAPVDKTLQIEAEK